jgi:hypothetical protein
MNVITQRAFTRNEYRAPIHFSDYSTKECPDCSTKEYDEGEMLNSSVGGMAFLAGREFKPGDGIFIKMVDIAPDPYWLEAKQDYYAEVRWCIKREGEALQNYQVGVRFLVETCRLCDKTIHHRSTDAEDLCEDCRNHVCSLSDGTIKECIENYLMGNVL